MRRRSPESAANDPRIPAELATFDLWHWAPDAPEVLEPRMPRDVARTVHDGWYRWCTARAEYAERNGWPGGEEARESQEAYAKPNVRPIFDPSAI